VKGQFVRSNAETVDDMTEKEKMECLQDIEMRRQTLHEELKVKKKVHQEMQRQRQAAREEKYNNEVGAAEALQEERRRKKVKELKAWLKKKEEQVRAKKEKEEAMMNEVLEKETAKNEANKILEQKRVEERERRLKAGERQKAKIEAQMILSRQERAERQAEKHSVRSNQEGGYPQSSEGQAIMPGQPANSITPQRVVHRHIHHHVHYHEGGGVEGGPGEEDMDQGSAPPLSGKGAPFVSDEEQRQIEMASEARVRAQLEMSGQPPMDGERHQSHHFHQHLAMPHADPGAITPTTENMRQAHSMAALLGDGNDQTQEAFYRGAMPVQRSLAELSSARSSVQEMGRRRGLNKYAGYVEKAFGSYADSGRPKHARHLPLSGPSSVSSH